MDQLSSQEQIRYSRHLALADFGMRGQAALKKGSALVVGAGGLGCPVLLYLAAAGVGRIGIVDHDNVDLSNLQRQVLYTVDDIGKAKAEVATEKILRLNPEITCIAYRQKITSANALDVIRHYDVVIDGSDNFPTRYLLNDACVLLDKPLVYGSILKYEGHVSVFNIRKQDGSFTANYRDLFPEPPDASAVPNCEEAGVIGVIPGLIGSLQANETIKILTGCGNPLSEKLLILDCWTSLQSVIKFKSRGTRDHIDRLIDYDLFCGISPEKNKSLEHNQKTTTMKEITVEELQELKESGADFQLIDVREPHEFDICNLGGELIPMNQVPNNVEKISKDKQVIVHCRSGKRSGDTIQWLEQNHNFQNLYNLKGGILAWANEIDPDMPTY